MSDLIEQKKTSEHISEDDFKEIDPDIDYFKLGLAVCAGMIISYASIAYIISTYF